MEFYAKRRTSKALLKLMRLKPKTARIIKNVESAEDLKEKVKSGTELVEEVWNPNLVWIKNIVKR